MYGRYVLEHSLHHSRHPQLNRIAATDDSAMNGVDQSVRTIVEVKKIDVTTNPE